MISVLIDRRHVADTRLALGLILPGLAGVAVYGWRAAGVGLLVLAGAMIAQALLRRFRTGYLTPGRVWLAIHAGLLTLFLPATLFDPDRSAMQPDARWPAAVAAGVLLCVVAGVLRRLGTARLSAVPLTLVLLVGFLPQVFDSDRVLSPRHLVVGDLFDDRAVVRASATAEPWVDARDPGVRVFITEPATYRIHEFLRGRTANDAPSETITRLVSDEIPPLEDFVIAGRAGRIGNGSAIALLIGGLFLVQRRLAPFRIIALMLAACYATLLVLPVPIFIGSDGVVRTMLAAADPRVGWATGITFVNDVFFAAPILLTMIYVALQGGVRPTGMRAAIVFALLLGIATAAATIFVSVRHGPILAVVALQWITPTLERWLPGRSG